MKYSPDVHHRHSIRLQGYDYSQAGAYFVTICTQGRVCLFGEIAGGKMVLNDVGRIVVDEWTKTVLIRDGIELDEWVVMPNHFHGIVIFSTPVGAIHESPLHESPLRMTVTQRRNMALPKLIGRFKMLSAKRINESRQTVGAKLWQRNYYEHIVRNENELNRIRQYIIDNPKNWKSDRNYIDAGNRVREPMPEYGHEPWMV